MEAVGIEDVAPAGSSFLEIVELGLKDVEVGFDGFAELKFEINDLGLHHVDFGIFTVVRRGGPVKIFHLFEELLFFLCEVGEFFPTSLADGVEFPHDGFDDLSQEPCFIDVGFGVHVDVLLLYRLSRKRA